MTQNLKRYEEETFALFSFFVVPHVLGMATYYTHTHPLSGLISRRLFYGLQSPGTCLPGMYVFFCVSSVRECATGILL